MSQNHDVPASHAPPQLTRDMIALYDNFTHGGMDRRTFMNRLGTLAGSTAAASAIMSILANDYAHSETIKPDDPRLTIEENVPVTAGETGLTGYLARPKDATRLPAVLVIHENRGLNPHIKDITRRVALEGYLAFGIDALSPDGGTPPDEDKAREMIGKLTGENAEARSVAAVRFLAQHKLSTGKVGAIGFCWGGGLVNRVASVEAQLKAGVAYYGAQVPAERVANIKGALLLHYAGLDQRINAGIAAFKDALDASKIRYEMHNYDGVDHAFNNDTNPARYNKPAADLAWSRSMEFLKRELA